MMSLREEGASRKEYVGGQLCFVTPKAKGRVQASRTVVQNEQKLKYRQVGITSKLEVDRMLE